MIEVAKLAMRVDTAQHVRRAIGRVTLSELDARRDTRWPRGAAGINFYLMSALDRSDDVPEDAIDLIKRTIGRAFRTHADRLHALFRTDSTASGPWLLLETHGHNIRLRAASRDPATHFLTSLFDRPVDRLPSTQTVRILLEYALPEANHGEDAWTSLARSLGNWATAVTAAEAAAPTAAAPVAELPRERILANALSAEAVLQRTGGLAEDATSWASRERRRDRLFGVWSRASRAFVHPDFQFLGTEVHPRLPELLQVLRTRVGFDPVDDDKGGWARAYWLYQPHPALSAQALAAARMDLRDTVTATMALSQLDATPRAPAELFATEADAVIALTKALADGASSRE